MEASVFCTDVGVLLGLAEGFWRVLGEIGERKERMEEEQR